MDEVGWYCALTLRERLPLQTVPYDSEPAALALGARRYGKLRAQRPFDDERCFARRLDQLGGITDEQFRYLLGETAASLKGRVAERMPVAAWVRRVTAGPSVDLRPNPAGRPRLPPLLLFLAPLLERVVAEIATELSALRGPNLPFESDGLGQLFMKLPINRLLQIVQKVLVLEMHVERLQGRLRGATPEARFSDFIEALCQPQATRRVLLEYPVMARQIDLCLQQWKRFAVDFVCHLGGDWSELTNAFGLHAADRLVDLVALSDDTHRGGRTVLAAHFSSGRKLIYKPRDLSVDIVFQEILEWLNRDGSVPPVRILKILNRTSHGWTEFVDQRDCADEREVSRFYQRFGALLALTHVLRGADFHYENVISCGDQPVLVDLEMLFQPSIRRNRLDPLADLVDATLEHSALSTGLLPMKVFPSDRHGQGLDVSALASDHEAPLPHESPYWIDTHTDAMRLAYCEVKLPKAGNLPAIAGTAANPARYVDVLIDGFMSTHGLLMKERERFTAPGGFLEKFAGKEVRVILRPTALYGFLLMESYHPDLVRDAIDRDLYFDQLWAQAPEHADTEGLVDDEQRQLQGGDIPIYTTTPESTDLCLSDGRRVRAYFCRSGLEMCRRILNGSKVDIDRQAWLIRASIAASCGDGRVHEQHSPRIVRRGARTGGGDLVGHAVAIGDHVVAMASRNRSFTSWLGVSPTPNATLSLHAADLDLYSGLPGIVLFLAYLGRTTGIERFTGMAEQGLATVLALMERKDLGALPIGAFNGIGGLVYVFCHLAPLLKRGDLMEKAKDLTGRLEGWVGGDEQLDIIGGAAGCLMCMLAYHKASGDERALGVADLCGHRLLSNAREQRKGVGWHVPGMKANVPLTGMAHGNAGIAWALAALWERTRDERLLHAARAALDYERDLFSAEAGNWPDLRGDQLGRFGHAWCHGAPGIGLARLACRRSLADSRIRDEIEAALETTLSRSLGGGHCLCHGDLGNLAFAFEAGREHGGPDALARARRHLERAISASDDGGWICGVPHGVATPGLMNGLAGIGLQLLRFADRDAVPSVLLLEPPIRGEAD